MDCGSKWPCLRIDIVKKAQTCLMSLQPRRRNKSSACCEWGTPCSPLMEICYRRYVMWEMHVLTDGVWDGCYSQSKTQVDVIFGWEILKDENRQENQGFLRNEDAWDSVLNNCARRDVWNAVCWKSSADTSNLIRVFLKDVFGFVSV